MFAFVYSKKDIASYTLYQAFKEVSKDYPNLNIYFHEYPVEVVYADGVDRALPREVETIIFLSRHSASSDISTLSVHTPGNFGDNPLGGRPGELAPANPCLVGDILREYNKNIEGLGIDYMATLEVTHHGPTNLSKPALFVEIGPSEYNWRDKVGARCIAISVFNALARYAAKRNCIKCVGFGGPHYGPNFTRYLLKTGDVGIGHIVSKYVLQEFSEEVVEKAIRYNSGVDQVLISWKGLKGPVRRRLVEYLMDKGYKYLKL